MSVSARDWYVSTDGSDTTADSWATAFVSPQTAFDNAQSGDTIYLAGRYFSGPPFGTNNNDSTVFLWEDVSTISVRGGYEASPALDPGLHPGPRDESLWPTVLAGSTEESRVLTMFNLSDVLVEHVTICNGSLKPPIRSSRYGGGVFLTNCQDIVFNDCVITNNYVGTHIPYGGGLSLVASAVVVSNCLVADNFSGGVGYNTTGHGGGVYIDGSSAMEVVGSVIRDNHARGTAAGNGIGGGFKVDSGGGLNIRKSVVKSNRTSTHYEAPNDIGAAVANYGTMNMFNCLVVSNRAENAHSDGVYSGGGVTTLANVTIVDNNSVGLRYAAGVIAVSNSIITGQTVDLMDLPDDAGALPVWYSCIGDGQNMGVRGCISVDPVFADTDTYHLQSTEGCYTGGCFSGGAWTQSAANSPLLDRGDPAADYSLEPAPNGGRVNAGAYGNTEVASKTPDITVFPPETANHGALAWGHRTAVLRGEITDTGNEMPDTWVVCWEQGSVVTNEYLLGLQGGVFEHSLSGLAPGVSYEYMVKASNSAGTTFSGVETFYTRLSNADLYVATNGMNTAGDSWETAYADLTSVFNMIEPGDTVYLAGHTFGDAPDFGSCSVFTLDNVTDIAVRGGYAATNNANLPGARDSVVWPTVLTWNKEGDPGRVLYMQNITNCVVENITMINGRPYTGSASEYGGGAYLAACSDVIFDACIFAANTCRFYSSRGGGIYLDNSAVVITNSAFVKNEIRSSNNSTVYGGGLFVDGLSRAVVSHSSFFANLAQGGAMGSGYGGAFHVAAGGKLELHNTLIAGNRAKRGYAATYGIGAAGASLGDTLMRNCLVVTNEADVSNTHSDGLFVNGGTTLVFNCTFVDNQSIGIRLGSGEIGVTNSIIWGHGTTDLMGFPVDGGGLLQSVGYSLFNEPSNMDGVNGCVRADPCFIDASGDDYRLQTQFGRQGPSPGVWIRDPVTSPAIDAGSNMAWHEDGVDLDGTERLKRGLHESTFRIVDMGVYEQTSQPQGSVFYSF